MSLSPVSPTVQAQQQQMAMNQDGVGPEQTSFNKKFGDAAYSIVGTKFPQIMKYIVTYKVLESDIDKGSGTGAFVIRKGDALVYLPIIMSSGRITSCEMLYSKEDHSFIPLNQTALRTVEAANNLRDPKVIGKAPFVDSTSQIFKDMFRPPSRSSVVIASDSNVSSLPNAAKEAIANHLQEDPELLAKIAEFYPIEALGQKLAKTKEVVASDLNEDTTIELLRLSDITKEASALLTKEAKSELLERGYYVKEPTTDRLEAASILKLASNVVTRMDLTEYKPTNGYSGVANILVPEGLEIVTEPVIAAENVILSKKGYYPVDGDPYLSSRSDYYNDTSGNCIASHRPSNSVGVVVSSARDELKKEDLLNFGAIPVQDFVEVPRKKNGEEICVDEDDRKDLGKGFIFYLVKNGGYRLFPYEYINKRSVRVRNIDGDLFFRMYGQECLTFTKRVPTGFIRTSRGNYILPDTCLMLVLPKRVGVTPIPSIPMLNELLVRRNTKITLLDDGVDIRVNDPNVEKTAVYKDEAEYHYAMLSRGLSKLAADTLLKEKSLLVFDKVAFIQPAQVEQPTIKAQQAVMPFAQTQQNQTFGPAPAEQLPAVDDSSIRAAAELQDEDLMDTGILASVATNDDIKGTLVDLIPNFTNTVTDLGKTILMFASSQEELEDYYGSDQYTTVLSNVRKIFTNLGKLVADLQSYINMNQHK